VIVAALVACGGVAEQESAGVEHRSAGISPVSERPLDYGRDRELLMPLLERAIIRARSANVLADAPPLPLTKRTGCPLTQSIGNRSAGGGSAVVSWHGAKVSNFTQARKPDRTTYGDLSEGGQHARSRIHRRSRHCEGQ